MALYSVEALRDEYVDLWGRLEIKPDRAAEATKWAKKVIAKKDVYQRIEKRTGIPWFVIGCMHYRESSCDFRTYLGNGDSLSRPTVNVPRGRGPFKSFEDGAYDALVTVENLDDIKDWGPEHVAYGFEKFNGWGYRRPGRNIPSPYLWGGTNVQKRGKFVRDGVYDSSVMDTQLGGMAVLKAVMGLDDDAQFRTSKPQKRVDPEPPADAPPPISPRADDTEGEVHSRPDKKTLWGTVSAFFIGPTGVLTIAGEKLHDPWVLCGLLGVVAIGGVAAVLILRGSTDLKATIRHLSEDDRS